MDKIYFDVVDKVLFKLEEEIDMNQLRHLYFEMYLKLEKYTKDVGLELKEYKEYPKDYNNIHIDDYEKLYVQLFYIMCMYNNQVFRDNLPEHEYIHLEYYKNRYERSYIIVKKIVIDDDYELKKY